MIHNLDQLTLGEHRALFGELAKLSSRIGDVVFAGDFNFSLEADSEESDDENPRIPTELLQIATEVISSNAHVDEDPFAFYASESGSDFFVEFKMNGVVVVMNIPRDPYANSEIIIMFNPPLRLILKEDKAIVHEYIPETTIDTIIQTMDDLEDNVAIASSTSLDKNFEETGRTVYHHSNLNGLVVTEGFSYVGEELQYHTFTWTQPNKANPTFAWNIPDGITYQFIGAPNAGGWEYKYYKVYSEHTAGAKVFNTHFRTTLVTEMMNYGDLIETFMNNGGYSVECSIESDSACKEIGIIVENGVTQDVFSIEMEKHEFRCYFGKEIRDLIAVFNSQTLNRLNQQNPKLPIHPPVGDVHSTTFEVDRSGNQRFCFLTSAYLLVIELGPKFVKPVLIFSNI